MKNIIYSILAAFLSIISMYGQDKATNTKPRNVIIINEEIVTMSEVEKYANEGRVKSMAKGVSEEKRNELAKKLGDRIGDKEFITIVELFTEKEKLENDKKNTAFTEEKVPAEIASEYILNVNQKAANFTLQLVDGTKVELADLKGKVVLVNFWATWCGPCLLEFYDIPAKILEPFKKEDFVLLAVSIGEPQEKVAKKVQKLRKDGLNFNYGIDPDKKIWNQYATNSIPKNFIIDQDGIIRFVSTGNSEGNLDTIAAEIRKLLKQ